MVAPRHALSARCLPALASLMLLGCGAAGGPDGGGANLPSRGIAPWTAPSEEPLLEPEAGIAYTRPSVLSDAAGALVHFTETGPEGSRLLRARLAPGGSTFTGAPEAILDDASDAGVFRGDDGVTWVAWVEGDGTVSVGRMDAAGAVALHLSTDLVATSPMPVVTPEGALRLYAIQDGAVSLADLGDEGITGTREVFTPGTGCVDDDGADEACWDGDAIVDLDVRLATTATGRRVWRMTYTGQRGSTHGFGFAASFDGVAWERYAFNPTHAAGNAARAPSTAVDGGRYVLIHANRTSRDLHLLENVPAVLKERW
jgi:hypothetical protein